MPAKATSRAKRGDAPPRVLNDSDACPTLFPTSCGNGVCIEAAPGALLMLSRGTTARLGLELLHAAMHAAQPIDHATLDEIRWRLDYLRDMAADLALLLPPKVLQ